MTQDWHPSASIKTLKRRAELISKIRAFFDTRSYMEVTTPIMAPYGVTDIYLENLSLAFQKQTYFLQTSPEYHMKRLLAAGSGSIYQLSTVFRDDELGRWHNPEFTMLEWYRLGFRMQDLIQEVDSFLQEILQCPPLIRKSYKELFIHYADIDPFEASLASLRACCAHYGLADTLAESETDRDQYLFLIMSCVIEPAMKEEKAPIAVYHFPPSQAALARVENGLSLRVEIYYKGIELANGFEELNEASEQSKRFEQDNLLRKQKGLAVKPVDKRLITALEQGFPECSGMALGVDRLLALALDLPSVSEVMAFALSRA